MWLGLTVILGALLSTAWTCPPRCYCDNSIDECRTCKDGYLSGVANDGNTYGCRWECPTNCRKCSDPYTCDECMDGYYSDWGWGSLKYYHCSYKCQPNCRTCSGKYICSECKDGYYNPGPRKDENYCQLSCPVNCKRCTGPNTCTECKQKFAGPKCDRCQDGYYGNRCMRKCSNMCVACTSNDVCTHCRPGYKGKRCNECVDGKYGTNCDLDCPWLCKTCTGADNCQTCKAGYSGIHCNQPCPENCTVCSSSTQCHKCKTGHYGVTCSMECPGNCKDGLCFKQNGNCTDGCIDGYRGPRCDKMCPEHCITCNSYRYCEKCEIGFYGPKCQNKCKHCKSGTPCRKSGGYCEDGCNDGYFGNTCKQTCRKECVTCTAYWRCDLCESRFHGDSCQYKCGHCRPGTVCNKSGGYCDDGCADGYYGKMCKSKCNNECKSCKTKAYCESCIDGKYGKKSHSDYKCDKNCPGNCVNKSCDSDTGNCLACVDGYTGDKCDENCSENCLNKVCKPDTGNCLACVDGYSGDKCDCPEHCQNCSSPGVCTSCKAGYVHAGKQCTCRKDVCTTDTCNACRNNTWYVDKESSSCCACSINCKNRECSKENRCTNGCVTGYYGKDCGRSCHAQDENCNECQSEHDQYSGCNECMQGFYPDDVNGTCIACHGTCANNICSSSNGQCLQGCLEKFWGEICNQTCPSDCLKCDRESGDCLECSSGKYGKYCSRNCSTTCNETESKLICDVDVGKCLHGCTKNTHYGSQCENKCNSQCLHEECDWKTGTCLQGCKDNFYGDTCATECSNECAEVESGRRCFDNNGSCVNDCLAGFYGDTCDQKCSEHCANATCSRDGGVCDVGCVDRYVGETCTQAEQTVDPDNNDATVGVAVGCVILLSIGLVVLVLLLRRRKQNNQKENTGSTTSQGGQEGAGAGGQEGAGVESIPLSPCVPRAGQSSGATCNNVSESVQLYAVPEKRKNYPVYSTPVKDQSHGQRPFSRTGNQAKSTVKQHDKRDSAANKNTGLGTTTPVYANNATVDTGETTFGATAAHATVTVFDGLNKMVNDEEEIDEDMVPPVTSGTENDVYYNTFSAGIAVEKLQYYVANTWTQGFDREFLQLPYGLRQPYDDSQKPDNSSKNRYKGIYPYDESRVRLAGPGSDYINACYIDGFQRDKAYIASLGPTEKTMPGSVDFWRMVWQKNVEKIVMLTNLYENGAMKCEQYWPDIGTSVTYGDVTVTCHSEDTYAEYTVRTFTTAKGSEKRSLHHIHFTAWPDKGVPDDVTGLIEFRQKVESCETKLDGPMTVHCSAGVGRTGTYIALDILTRQGHKDRAVNIYGCVLQMREQRVCMVQTKEQYHYLHQAVVHALTFDSDAIQGEKFKQRLADMKGGHLVKQFQQLQKTCVHLSEEETEAVKTNKSRDQFNRKGADIPGNLYRPRLTKQEPSKSSDYINAVYINSFTRSSHYITAQTPLPNTVTDFLTLIDQYNCVCIVSMEPGQLKDKSVGVYLPGDNKSVKHGPFTVTSGINESGPNYNVQKLTLSQQGHGGPVEKTLSHFQLTQWPDTDPTPRDAGKFVEFIKKVESSATETDPNGRILVHCLTGAERSGLFCVVSVLIQKMEIEYQVSVVNTVRQVKSRRMLAILNKEQFIFCHDCVDAYLKTFDIYSNFSAV